MFFLSSIMHKDERDADHARKLLAKAHDRSDTLARQNADLRVECERYRVALSGHKGRHIRDEGMTALGATCLAVGLEFAAVSKWDFHEAALGYFIILVGFIVFFIRFIGGVVGGEK
jgi:hypothetical protein